MANSSTVGHDVFDDVEWLTIPDLVEALGISQSQVRRLIEDKHLVAIRREGILVVPSSFIRESEIVSEIHGTVTVLCDMRFTDEEIVQWLVDFDETLSIAPIDALRAGRKSEVRRVAMTLG